MHFPEFRSIKDSKLSISVSMNGVRLYMSPLGLTSEMFRLYRASHPMSGGIGSSSVLLFLTALFI